jgi:hypothetical protein
MPYFMLGSCSRFLHWGAIFVFNKWDNGRTQCSCLAQLSQLEQRVSTQTEVWCAFMCCPVASYSLGEKDRRAFLGECAIHIYRSSDYQIIDDLADSSPTIMGLIWSKLIGTISSHGVVLWTEGRNQTTLHSEPQKYLNLKCYFCTTLELVQDHQKN